MAESAVDADVETWPRPPEGLLQSTLAGAETTIVVSQDTRRALLVLFPLRAPDGRIAGAVEVASSLALTDSVEARVRTMLLVGTTLALLVAAVLSLRATRSALRPLEQVIQAARRIGAGRLDERLRLRRRDEIGQLAEAFDSMLDRLAAAMLAQRRFVADAAHELRTPLTAIGGMIDMLEMGAHRGDPARIQRILDTMNREVQRLGRLVADLLTLSRLDADQPLRAGAVDSGDLVAEVAQQTRLIATGQQVDLEIEAHPVVWGDADRLKQVLLNLASNALAHTPAGARILFRVESANGRVRIIVADTGSGIAPDLLPRVMDRFSRGDDSRSRATGGAGLGLSIARGIVEAHHGTIALASEAGQGTTVTVELPIWDGVHQPPTSAQRQVPGRRDRLGVATARSVHPERRESGRLVAQGRVPQRRQQHAEAGLGQRAGRERRRRPNRFRQGKPPAGRLGEAVPGVGVVEVERRGLVVRSHVLPDAPEGAQHHKRRQDLGEPHPSTRRSPGDDRQGDDDDTECDPGDQLDLLGPVPLDGKLDADAGARQGPEPEQAAPERRRGRINNHRARLKRQRGDDLVDHPRPGVVLGEVLPELREGRIVRRVRPVLFNLSRPPLGLRNASRLERLLEVGPAGGVGVDLLHGGRRRGRACGRRGRRPGRSRLRRARRRRRSLTACAEDQRGGQCQGRQSRTDRESGRGLSGSRSHVRPFACRRK